MIAWVDAFLLPLILAFPILGAFFLAIMPKSDRIALRQTAMIASIATGLVALRASWNALVLNKPVEFLFKLTFLDTDLHFELAASTAPIFVSIAFLFPMAIRAGAPRIISGTQGYAILMLSAQLFACAALLIDDLLWRVALFSFSSLPTIFLMATFGAPQRGSTAMRVSVTMMITDCAAFAALSYAEAKRASGVEMLDENTEMLLLIPVILAGAFRLGLVPMSAPFVSCLRQSPVAGAALVTGVWMPMANTLLIGAGFSFFPRGAALLAPWVVVLCLLTAVLGAIMTFSDRDLRRLAGAFAMGHGAFGVFGFATGDVLAMAASTVYMPLVGLSLAFLLFSIDALERRYLSRDLTEMMGVNKHLPTLWRILLAAIASCIGIPIASAGALMVPIIAGVLRHNLVATHTLPPAFYMVSVFVMCTSVFLWCAGAIVIFRHVCAPQTIGDSLAPDAFTAGQAARLWFPGVLILAGAAISFWVHGLLVPHMSTWVKVVEAAS